jgi:hypothetical protein
VLVAGTHYYLPTYLPKTLRPPVYSSLAVSDWEPRKVCRFAVAVMMLLMAVGRGRPARGPAAISGHHRPGSRTRRDCDFAPGTGAQGVAHREGEGDFPDGTVEFAAADQMGTPVGLHEAEGIIRRQRVTGAGIQGTHNFDGLEYAAGGGLEWKFFAGKPGATGCERSFWI